MKLNALVAIGALFAACHSGGPGAQPGLVVVRLGSAELHVVEGIVVDANGAGLPGVVVTGPAAEPSGRLGAAGAPVRAVTDAAGRFLVVAPPTGTHTWVFDGAAAHGRYPALAVRITTAPGRRTLAAPVVLPDLASAAEAPVALAGGAATAETVLSLGDLSLRLAPGTAVQHAGPPAGDLPLALAPLAPAQLPAALPEGFHALSAALVAPVDARFAPPLDLALPNPGLPPGTAVEVWTYGGDGWAPAGAGQVSADGARIETAGAVAGGGILAAVLPVDPLCATAVAGTVVLPGGEPVAGALVTVSTGQGAVTDATGAFFVGGVPAYDPAALPACVPAGFTIGVLPPAAVGGDAVQVDVAAPQPGFTDAGRIVLGPAPTAGILAGRVADAAGTVPREAVLEGPMGGPLALDGNGAFALGGVAPGSYTVSLLFPGETAARRATVEVSAARVASVVLERLRGAGARTIEVQVLQLESFLLGGASAPLSGATVTLVGTDAVSAAGLVGTSNADGVVVFEDVDGPFTVTAQKDLVQDLIGDRIRRGATVMEIDPPDDRIGVPLDGDGFPAMAPTDALLTGTVVNLPPDYGNFPASTDQIILNTAALLPDGTRVPGFAIADPTGAWAVPVPSGAPIELTLAWESGVAGAVGAIVRDIAPLAPGGFSSADLDLQGPDFLPFDRLQPVTLENLVPGTFYVLSIGASTPRGGLVGFTAPPLFAQAPSETVALMLPDFTQPGLPLSQPRLGITEGPLTVFDSFDLPVDGSPATFAVLAQPALLSPAGGQVTSAAARVFDVAFDVDPARPGPGPNQVIVDAYLSFFDPSAALHRVQWSIYSAPDHTAYRLPPVALPVFLPGAEGALVACTLSRTEGPFLFDAFFGGDLRSNLAAFFSGRSCGFAGFRIE